MTHSPAGSDRSAQDRSHTELIIILGLLATIGPLSIDTYLPGLPAIGRELGASAALVAQSVSAYFFGLAAGQIVCGPLSDRYGRRPILFTGLGVYLVASVGCVLVGVLLTGTPVAMAMAIMAAGSVLACGALYSLAPVAPGRTRPAVVGPINPARKTRIHVKTRPTGSRAGFKPKTRAQKRTSSPRDGTDNPSAL